MHRRTGWREWAEWYRLTPEERFAESEKLWETYLALGGSLEPEPILRTLSSIRRIGNKPGARTLLMGGQSCVFYGAAEFDDLRKKRKNEEDWPIILRLVERSYLTAGAEPSAAQNRIPAARDAHARTARHHRERKIRSQAAQTRA